MIGIFDSGSGGLTVLQAIKEILPSANVVYFGDIGNAPYGEKTHTQLSALTTHAVQVLLDKDVTKIVSACNSTSASLAVSLFDVLGMGSAQLIEMVGPTVSYFKNSDARLLVCATPATVASGVYQRAFSMIGKDVDVCPVPDLAGLIEFGAPTEEIQACIQEAFSEIDSYAYDAVLLSCTHYPLVAEQFGDALKNKELVLFDPALEVAARVESQWWPEEVSEGAVHFILTEDSALFEKRVATLFPEMKYSLEVIAPLSLEGERTSRS